MNRVRSRSQSGTLLPAFSLVGCILTLAYGSTPAAWGQETPPNRANLTTLQDAFTSIADELEPAVVTILAEKKIKIPGRKTTPEEEGENAPDLPGRSGTPRAYRTQGTGSGVIISRDGWVLTNDHVVEGATRVRVRMRDGREYEGTVRRDYRSDLALIKISAPESFPAARLGNSEKTKIGQWAIAIGSPFRYEGSLSVGVISSLFRRQEISDGTGPGRLYPNMIQTDAAINPGNSGGPLVNLDGEVIGINTAIESPNGRNVGIGFAIPINTAKFVIEQLQTKGSVSYGYLGIEPETITPRLAALFKVTDGAMIQNEPARDTPAGKAGLQVEDVIVRIDGKKIATEIDLRTTVSQTTPGKDVEIVYVRGGAEKTTHAVIGALPAGFSDVPNNEAPKEAGDAKPVKINLGVEVVALTPEDATRLGVAKESAILIKSIEDAGPFSESFIRKGDAILRVNGVATPTLEAFYKALEGIRRGDPVRVVWQGKRTGEIVKRVAIITAE